MQLFYAPDIEITHQLPIDESRHCFNVLRKKVGDEINVIDGKGGMYFCKILDDNPKRNKLEIISVDREFNKQEKYIHVVIAPTKNLDRTEWFVEKAIEIGVSEISFVLTNNSERRSIKLDRIQKKVVSAMKQSLKAKAPILNDLKPLNELLPKIQNNNKVIVHIDDSKLLFYNYINDKKPKGICLLIGPEGGFTSEEVSSSIKHGFEVVSLGKSRLRTETAGVVIVSLLNQVNV